MNEAALQLVRETIGEWMQKRQYTYEKKECMPYLNAIANGEWLIYFRNGLFSFFCGGELIPIELRSQGFMTTTISENRMSDNPKADQLRLGKFLEDFDKKFYLLVESKMKDCEEKLTTSDPAYWV